MSDSELDDRPLAMRKARWLPDRAAAEAERRSARVAYVALLTLTSDPGSQVEGMLQMAEDERLTDWDYYAVMDRVRWPVEGSR